MWRITKQFHFSAAHQLHGLPDGHPCGRLHGHNYIVEVVLEGELDMEHSWVRDFGDLDIVKDFLDSQWDHRNLNDWFRTGGNTPDARYSHGLKADAFQTTAEALAMVLYTRFQSLLHPHLAAVRVSETPKTWAEFPLRARRRGGDR